MNRTQAMNRVAELTQELADKDMALTIAHAMLRQIEEGGTYSTAQWDENLGCIEAIMEKDTPRAMAFARTATKLSYAEAMRREHGGGN